MTRPGNDLSGAILKSGKARQTRAECEDSLMPIAPKPTVRLLLLGTAMILLGACGTNSLDWDLRQPGSSLDTTSAAQGAAAARPQPDSRGVISYSTYQVAVAQRGDSVAGLASRIGLGADEVARYNGLQADTVLRTGEVLALPRRVDAAGSASSPSALQPGGGPGSAPGSAIDITTLAAGAIERAGATATPVSSQPQGVPGREPIRHQVLRGETSYSIARLYNVSPKALADWNGLGPDLAVREGQFLLIPVPGEAALEAATAASESAPGQGSATPVPPSAATPLPEENPEQTAATITPPSPNLATGQTSASAGQFAYPETGVSSAPMPRARTRASISGRSPDQPYAPLPTAQLPRSPRIPIRCRFW